MKDRVSLYPGRVKLTPVSGQENTYDMVRADEPTQEGTPLSKATFLKDETAALFGLNASAVPDDVFKILPRYRTVMVRLWQNASPGSGFAQQTVSIPKIDEYTFVCIKYSSNTNQSEYIWSGIADCVHTCIITAHMHSGTYRSAFTQPQFNAITFFDCKNSENHTINGNMIPLEVYGISGIKL